LNLVGCPTSILLAEKVLFETFKPSNIHSLLKTFQEHLHLVDVFVGSSDGIPQTKIDARSGIKLLNMILRDQL